MELSGLGNYFIIGVLIALIGGSIGYGIFALVSKKSRGAWDKQSDLVGKIRSRKWRYKEYIESAQEHLLPAAQELQYWPALRNSGGHDAVTNTRNEVWRSVQIHSANGKQNLYYTFEIPQRGDGTVFAIPEVLFTSKEIVHDDGVKDYQWTGQSADTDVLRMLANGDFAKWLEKIQAVEYVHLVGGYLTIVIGEQNFEPSLLELLEQLTAAAKAAAAKLPENFWN